MKNLLLLILGSCLVMAIQAQTTAFDYMKKAPAIPSKVCSDRTVTQNAFSTSVRNLSEAIHEDAANRSKAAEEYMDGNQDAMKANMMKKSGLTDEEMKKLQNGDKMSEADAQALANRMIQQQANMSLDEAKKLGKMSDAGQQAWAQGYAAEQMANAQANPGGNAGTNQGDREMYELLAEQTSLRNKISAMENQLQQKYQAIERDAQADKAKLEVELKPLYDELHSINDGEGSTQADVDHATNVIMKIQAKQDVYCEKFTPVLLKFIGEAKSTFSAAFPDYDRLEEIQLLVTASQTGTEIMSVGKGLYSIQAVEQYLGYLGEAYRYKLYSID